MLLSCRLLDVRRSALICSGDLWMLANHCFGVSLGLTAGHWDRLFCIQNTLTLCLCQRRFHYLTGYPESLVMIPMATWHTEIIDQIGWWCEIMWHEMLFFLCIASVSLGKVFSNISFVRKPCFHCLNETLPAFK